MDFDIDLDMLDELTDLGDDLIVQNERKDIAIVGLAVRAGEAENAEELWNVLANGEELKRPMPFDRAADADQFAEYLGRDLTGYSEQSYLERIDEFSPGFFQIPPKDAALIDPAQRMFLMTAYRALEDAGLSKKRLAGSQTGVFVGYTTNPDSYSQILSDSDTEFADRAVAGKVNSIIASRLSYYLDLNGPAVMVDTACSSSLVAIHMACNSIRNGECEMAVAGSVKYTLLPLNSREDGEISVVSGDGQTRTFDINSGGTNPGEGVAAIILKPLDKAIADKDRIYAVIKGSAINQDGASVGITAPNAAAQEAVIVQAWENAGIEAEQVSYIEAHGTATKLGDPVEISGIERAFRRFTDKRQFCAVGSIKTNMGHLDCAAGILGLIKCVLAIKHKQIPPQLHFTSPNREIDFIQSPVFISDTLADWESEGLRTCGVSSFGLSGTNCHVVLQEYKQEKNSAPLPMILPLSARKKTELKQMAERFASDAKAENLADLIFTAAMSRSDDKERIAIVVRSMDDVLTLPERIEKDAKTASDTVSLPEEIFSRAKDGEESAMQELCIAYMQGADVPWKRLYEDLPVNIASMQGYPMLIERCWQAPKKQAKPTVKTEGEPLLDACLAASPLVHIYSTMLSEATHSEVREHIIGERNVLAGTVYVEMLRSAASKMLSSTQMQIDNLVFMSAMIFEKDQVRQAQTVLYQKSENEIEATIQSKAEGEDDWTVHVQAKISALTDERPQKVDVEALFAKMGENVMDETTTTVDRMVTTGPRWKVQKGIWIAENEAVTMAMPDAEFAHELKDYHLYPSMLDAAVNCSSVLNGDIFCLPYYYGSMRIYERMPQKIYSHTVKNLQSSSADGEINVFDIVIFDENGTVLATVKDYAMKKTSERQKKQFFARTEPMLRTLKWKSDSTKYRPASLKKAKESIVLVTYNDICDKKIQQSIKTASQGDLYELVLCDWLGKRSERKAYAYPEDRNAIEEYFEDLENRQISRVIMLLPRLEETTEALKTNTEVLTKGFFNVIYALASNKNLGSLSVDLLIPFDGERVHPLAQTIAGMGKSVLFEYSRLRLRSVLYTQADYSVIDELTYNHSDYMVMLKDGERLVPMLDEIETQGSFRLKENGTYLITGGAGGIGIEIAQELARIEPTVNLVLLGRRHIGHDEPKYLTIQAIKAASVRYVPCDVADEEALTKVFEQIGGVNGVIHAAGLPGGGFIIKRPWEEFYDVLKPKIYGAWKLMELAKNADFVALFSSYASVLAVAGQADYIGANSFIDACAVYDNVKVISWGGWKETGMAKDNGVDMVKSPLQFMTNAEGVAAFTAAMGCQEKHVLVGKFNYSELAESLEDYRKVVHFSESDTQMLRSNADQKKNANKTYDITVHGKETALTATEQKVAQAWAKILGLREVDYQDKFLEVGGDSLSATYLQKEIDIAYPGVMDITDVFVYPTIEQMATFIDSKTVVVEKKPTAKTTDADQMRQLLEQLASGQIDLSKAGELI